MGKLDVLLAENRIFADLTDRERNFLAGLAIRRSFFRGEYVAHYGDFWPFVFIVDEGVISVLKLSPDGRMLGGLKMEAGDLFWNPCIFDNGPMPATLEVKSNASLYIWHRDHLLPILKSNPETLWEACLLLVERMRAASGFVEELAFQPVAGRLAHLLLDQSKHTTDAYVSRDLTLDEMAGMIGTTPVMVCKLLSRFAGEGLIKLERTRFSLLDMERLKEISSQKQL